MARIADQATAKRIYREADRLRLVGGNGRFEIVEDLPVENPGRVVLRWKASVRL